MKEVHWLLSSECFPLESREPNRGSSVLARLCLCGFLSKAPVQLMDAVWLFAAPSSTAVALSHFSASPVCHSIWAFLPRNVGNYHYFSHGAAKEQSFNQSGHFQAKQL